MSDSRPPYHRRKTKPFPRVRLAPIAKAPLSDPDEETKVTCPCCAGAGVVAASVLAEWNALERAIEPEPDGAA